MSAVKLIVSVGMGLAASHVVETALKSTVPVGTSVISRGARVVGSFAVGSMIGSMVSDHVEAEMTRFGAMFKKLKKTKKSKKEEVKVESTDDISEEETKVEEDLYGFEETKAIFDQRDASNEEA